MNRFVNDVNRFYRLEVSSIEDYLENIEKSGGKLVTPKTPVGDFGFYAEVLDTENNTIGLWEDKE